MGLFHSPGMQSTVSYHFWQLVFQTQCFSKIKPHYTFVDDSKEDLAEVEPKYVNVFLDADLDPGFFP